jgi:hypothetical protein
LLRPSLESLLNQEHPPNWINICVPTLSRRENAEYRLPDFLDPRPFDSRIRVLRARDDFGPGTKLLGVLDHVSADDILIIADDDNRYRPFFIRSLVEAQREDRRASFSFYTYRFHGLPIAQGADGISFIGRHLVGIRDFARTILPHGRVRFHDDYWISFFLATRGIQVRSLADLLRRRAVRMVYEAQHCLNSLNELGLRDALNRECERACLEHGEPGLALRSSVRAHSVIEQMVDVAKPAGRILPAEIRRRARSLLGRIHGCAC